MDLSCPQPENYAAIAKQLHLTALQAEARIFELEHELRSAVNRPTYVQTSTATITGIVANLEENIGPFGGGNFVTTFDNTGAAFENIDSPTMFNITGEGMYEIGMYANVIASGAVNDNSWRSFRIAQQRPDPTAPNGTAIVDEVSYTMFESNTGVGASCCLVGHFRIREGDSVRFFMFHQNTSSTLNASIGNIVWLHKLSDSSNITVV